MTLSTMRLAGVLLAGSTLSAAAAGIERAAPGTRVLFEDGRYLEFSAAYVAPELSGEGGLLLAPGADTGNLLEDYATFGVAYKAELTNRISYAVILGTPWGVDTDYPAETGSSYAGTSATLDSYGLTGILAWNVTPRIKVYGGVRGQSMEAKAAFPFGAALGLAGPYDVDASREFGFGYMGGVAYSRPDIALRVALTYYSQIETTHDTTETIAGISNQTRTGITTPRSVNLEAQTGIAEDTLLFGAVRWADWSEFGIAPPDFTTGTGAALVDYEEDWITYTLGLGRRFTERWSGAVQGSWEPASDTTLTTLGPIDGRWSAGVSATYELEGTKITGGLTYVSLGEAENFAATGFDGGDAIGAGLRVGFSF